MDLKDLLWEETDDGIVTVTFNRPEDLNPISLDGLDELNRVLDEVRENDRYRVLIFTGAGRAFSAGADVKKLPDAAFRREIPHRTSQERPVLPHVRHDPGIRGDRLLGCLPVGGEVVFAAQPVVVDASGVGMAGV